MGSESGRTIRLRCGLVQVEERLTQSRKPYISLAWDVSGQPEFGWVFDNIIYENEWGAERLEELGRAIGVPVDREYVSVTLRNWLDARPLLLLEARLETLGGRFDGREMWQVKSYWPVPS